MNLPRLSAGAEKVMSMAALESAGLGHGFLGVEHLFLAVAKEIGEPLEVQFKEQEYPLTDFMELLRQRISVPGRRAESSSILLFTRRGREVLSLAGRIASRAGLAAVEPDHMFLAILREGRSVPVRLLRTCGLSVADLEEAVTVEEAPPVGDTPLLARYGRDLTALARAGRLMPVVGRDPEMDLLAQVLLRKNKNNPVLVGEAGVGKTAVVEGFAQLLVSPECPGPLRDRRLIELSMASLVAGTKYRGEFEERLLALIEELSAHTEIIVFLDEIHTVVGTGAGGGDALDASNIMKPALARGELRVIGATTIEEFRRHIEKDGALERRFEKILVNEPSPIEALAILNGVREAMELHHQVEIDTGALAAAVELTVRYVPDRQLPDNALDALDQTCARKRLEKYGRGPALSDAGATIERPRIVDSDITLTVAQWTGIPLERLSQEGSYRFLNLEEELNSRVIGQEHAVKAVARAVLTSRAGLSAPMKPAGVFLFLGPTGVGKTELARSLARTLFADEKRLVRFDMSEFTEPHSVAKLIGAPPGYVGYEKEGLLISALRTHPHCVVLFDEIEKAHPQVYDLFLQIFDEGRLTGAHGKSADFTQAIVILTSNIDTAPATGRPLGFIVPAGAPEGTPGPDPRIALASHFRPELINRIDDVIVFRPLGKEQLRRIIDRYVREIGELLKARHFDLKLDEAVYDRLIELGAGDRFGARELRRVVDRHLRQPLAREVLTRTADGGTITVSIDGDDFRFV